MLTGKGLGILKPGFIARKDARDAYAEMENSKEFQNPISYSSIKEKDYKALLLPGGHAPGMKEYLESKILQKTVVDFFIRKNLWQPSVTEFYLRQEASTRKQTNQCYMTNKRPRFCKNRNYSHITLLDFGLEIIIKLIRSP